MKRSTVFTASDGTTFDTAATCTTYEKTILFLKCLTGMTDDQVLAALSRADVQRADAFEHAGNIISSKRRESGEFRRAKKKAA